MKACRKQEVRQRAEAAESAGEDDPPPRPSPPANYVPTPTRPPRRVSFSPGDFSTPLGSDVSATSLIMGLAIASDDSVIDVGRVDTPAIDHDTKL